MDWIMNAIKLLDVSLRDGGHRTNFHFKDDDLKTILTSLDSSGIDYIEIGYRNGSLHPIPNLGRAGFCDQDYLKFCRSLINEAKIAVMIHPGNIADIDIKNLKDCGVHLLRICVTRGGVATALPLIKLIKDSGMNVSVNFIHASQYEEKELDIVVDMAMNHHPDIVYFADSNGSLMPEQAKKIYTKYTQRYQTAFGFHAHDNLGLAQANTLAAMSAGAQYIDASLAGMGKGIGNLKTEFFTAYLHANNIQKYKLQDILNAANHTRHALHIGQEPIDMDEFVRGIFDLSTAEVRALQNQQGQEI
jgi:4-hydroxy 2-oxovalerate aldolase